PERFVRLYYASRHGEPFSTFSYPDFVDMRELRGVFEGAIAEQQVALTIGLAGAAERVWGELASERYFQLLGVHPARGRFFTPEEDHARGGEGVVVLGITQMPLGPEGFQPRSGERWPRTEFARVDTDYFRTMRIPLVEEREFGVFDTAQSPDTVVINDVIARQFWPDAPSVVGRRVVTPTGYRFEVVGVARWSKYFSIGETPKPYVYFPLRQGSARAMTVVARVSGDVSAGRRRGTARREGCPPVDRRGIVLWSRRCARDRPSAARRALRRESWRSDRICRV